VDPSGNVAASLPPYEPAVLCGTIGIELDQTFYVRFGWLIPWVAAVFALTTGLIVAFRRLR
jgi:apolipoprotein N-acyltransferase